MPTELTELPSAVHRLGGPSPAVRRRRRRPSPAAPRPRPASGPIGRRCRALLAAADETGLRREVDGLMAEGLTATSVLQELLLPAVDSLGSDARPAALGLVAAVAADVRSGTGAPPACRALVIGPPADDDTATLLRVALRDDGWDVPSPSPLSPAAAEAYCDLHRIDLVVTADPSPAIRSELDTRFADRRERVVHADPGATLYALQWAARAAT